ncbi:MAG: helix-turn-helix domain-containing protein [Clostridia bacterium]|nr:helix-turn-helix domain-containing protein [Clostridia bacterium]
MELFSEKLKKARKEAGLSQADLADLIGVSPRSVTDYERGCAVPRYKKIQKIAETLGVTVLYLTTDSISDRNFGENIDQMMQQTGDIYGEMAAMEMSDLINRNTAFLAGGQVPQSVKDKFFEALMKAYIACKEEAEKEEP